jgi:hypothetical protein
VIHDLSPGLTDNRYPFWNLRTLIGQLFEGLRDATSIKDVNFYVPAVWHFSLIRFSIIAVDKSPKAGVSQYGLPETDGI